MNSNEEEEEKEEEGGGGGSCQDSDTKKLHIFYLLIFRADNA